MQDELGLNLYDFDARHYDPMIVRTLTLDPHAEYYPEFSPYSFLDDNPVNMIDPTGMDAMELNEGNGGMATCSTCPQNDPKYKPYIDDPNNDYFYDPNSGVVSKLLPEVEVTSGTPSSSTSLAMDVIITLPQVGPLIEISATAIGATALTVALVFTPVAGAGDGEMEALEKMRVMYTPAPKALKGFPNAQRARQKVGRARWINDNGDILEWDSQHGEVEVYNKQGKHKGAADPDTGQIKPDSQVPGRTTEK